MCRNHTKNNFSTGPRMQVRSTISPLTFNFANMRLAQHKIGTEAWWRSFWLQMTALGYRELEGLLSATEGASQLRAAIETKGHLSTTRVKRASAKLLECPSQDVSFVTVITDIACTKEEALALLKSTGDQLDRFIRERFPKAIWLMFPEVDIQSALHLHRFSKLITSYHFTALVSRMSFENTETLKPLIYSPVGFRDARTTVFDKSARRAMTENP